MKGRRFVRGATATVLKRAQLALLLCGIVGIASKLLVSTVTVASPTATGTNSDEPSRGQTLTKAPLGMVWIPGGTFLMGTNDKREFSKREACPPRSGPGFLDGRARCN